MRNDVYPWRDAPPGDYAVIGDPIAHSKSPAMHHAAYRALGLGLTYRAIHVPVGEVDEALDHLREIGYRGVNVTVPHKETALLWARDSDPVARETGGANTLALSDRFATNTDGPGLYWSLLMNGLAPRRVLLLGAGGTAATVVLRLTERAELAIWNRHPDRARRLIADLGTRLEATPGPDVRDRDDNPVPTPSATSEERRLRRRGRLAGVRVLEKPDLRGYDLIVNATPASLRGEDLGLDWSRADPNATAYDLAYGVDDAPFLRKARESGLRTLDGRDMLAMQGAFAFAFWGLLGRTSNPTGAVSKSTPSQLGLKDLGRIMREALG